MEKIEIEIKGETPYLMHAFPMTKADEKETKRPGISDYTKEVEESLYRLPDGKIYVPSTQIQGSLIEAGKNFQIPGKKKSTYSGLIGGLLIITPDAIIINPQEFVIDRRSVVVPATRGRVIRERPKFNNWSLKFNIENLEEDGIPNTTVKKILDYAGSYIGIGDFRPKKKGPFGRFIVTKFKEV